MVKLRNDLLEEILTQPTAPFREKHVIAAITRRFDAEGVPYFLDPVENIVVGASSKNDYLRLIQRRSREPVRIFMAHMDHPGFHGVKWKSPRELEIQWHGGSPTRHLTGAKVWLASAAQGLAGEGTLSHMKMLSSGHAIKSGTVRVNFPGARFKDAKSLYGGLHFRKFFWRKGKLIYTKAADDLVGSFAIASLALDLKHKKVKAPWLGLLTRAEEVGFIGAIGHFNLGWLEKARREILCVSLETSRTLPGAEIGKGPVVRLGDRYTVFHPGALRVFTELAQKTLPGKHQRRIMDGGTCEATAATVFGFPSIGISVPLGNYHNQSFEGGPDSRGPFGPAPEFVHVDDVGGLVELCHALLKPNAAWFKPWEERKKAFRGDFRKSLALLRSGP